jgi:type IV pilus assembly protein PilB
MDSFKKKLIDILIHGKLITKEQLATALDIQKNIGGSLGKILIWQGYVSQKDIVVAMSQQLNIPPINLSKYQIDKSLIDLIPERIVKQYLIMPISRIGKMLTIAMVDPLNIFAIDDIKTLTNYQIQPIIASENDIKEAINDYYGAAVEDISDMLEETDVSDIMEVEKGEGEEHINVSEVAEESKKAPIVKVVNLILNEAMKRRSSDIHIEPREKILMVRYRVDGNLEDALTLPKKNQNAIIARLKIMSGLDITETRMPQDGRFKISFEGKEIDFRVSILPVTYGGKIVLRALDKSSLSIGLDKLGFLPRPLSTFKAALAVRIDPRDRPYGER